MRRAWFFVLLCAILGCGKNKQKQALPIDQVPERVMSVAREKLPEVAFDRALKKANGDYEVLGKDKRGKVRELDITPTGEIVEVE